MCVAYMLRAIVVCCRLLRKRHYAVMWFHDEPLLKDEGAMAYGHESVMQVQGEINRLP